MKAVIIEDEKKAVLDLKRILQKLETGIEVVKELDSIEGSVEWLTNQPLPDVIFMDIQLADGLSFRIFSRVSITCPVIFCTAYDKYAVEAFKTNGIGYLLKPVDETELKSCLDKIRTLQNHFLIGQKSVSEIVERLQQQQRQFKTTYLVQDKVSLIPIKTEAIACFLIEEGWTYILLENGKRHTVAKNLDELEEELDPAMFFRANRQNILSANFIKSIEHYNNRKLLITLKATEQMQIMISKEKASEFLSWMESR